MKSEIVRYFFLTDIGPISVSGKPYLIMLLGCSVKLSKCRYVTTILKKAENNIDTTEGAAGTIGKTIYKRFNIFFTVMENELYFSNKVGAAFIKALILKNVWRVWPFAKV